MSQSQCNKPALLKLEGHEDVPAGQLSSSTNDSTPYGAIPCLTPIPRPPPEFLGAGVSTQNMPPGAYVPSICMLIRRQVTIMQRMQRAPSDLHHPSKIMMLLPLILQPKTWRQHPPPHSLTLYHLSAKTLHRPMSTELSLARRQLSSTVLKTEISVIATSLMISDPRMLHPHIARTTGIYGVPRVCLPCGLHPGLQVHRQSFPACLVVSQYSIPAPKLLWQR
jgi:hypothetical protein